MTEYNCKVKVSRFWAKRDSNRSMTTTGGLWPESAVLPQVLKSVGICLGILEFKTFIVRGDLPKTISFRLDHFEAGPKSSLLWEILLQYM